jgi:hypothetical protein
MKKSLKRKKKIKLQQVYNNRDRDFQLNDIRHPINEIINLKESIIMKPQNRLFENFNELSKSKLNKALNEAVEFGISPKQFIKDIKIVNELKSLCESDEQFNIERNRYFDEQCVKAMESGKEKAADFYDLLIIE